MYTYIFRYEIINKYQVIIVQLQNKYNKQLTTQNVYYTVKQENEFGCSIEKKWLMGQQTQES